MYVGGLAGLELLRKENPEAAEKPRAVAGLSLGEYTALTVAGVFDLETGPCFKISAHTVGKPYSHNPVEHEL